MLTFFVGVVVGAVLTVAGIAILVFSKFYSGPQ